MILLVNKEGTFVEVDTSPTTTLLSERVERLKSAGYRLATAVEQQVFYKSKRRDSSISEKANARIQEI